MYLKIRAIFSDISKSEYNTVLYRQHLINIAVTKVTLIFLIGIEHAKIYRLHSFFR